jgi:hypothetical protein
MRSIVNDKQLLEQSLSVTSSSQSNIVPPGSW